MTISKSWAGAFFISVEGIDGAGKSTVVEHLQRWIELRGHPVQVLREPGGTVLGEKIRAILLDPSHSPIAPWAEACLYAASQAQQIWETILPSLAKGVWILADRFRDATVAYQGWGRDLGEERVRDFQMTVLGSCFPDLTVLLDCDVLTAWNRVSKRSASKDRIEQEAREFMEKVRQGYLTLARKEPRRFVVIDAAQTLGEVLQDVTAALTAFLERRGGQFSCRG